jgi:TM2 domain-containing membrane protein YozV
MPAPVGNARIVAGILALVLGWVGAHHFFLGRWGLGALCLVLAVLALMGFWPLFLLLVGVAIVDGVRYLTMSDLDFPLARARWTPYLVGLALMAGALVVLALSATTSPRLFYWWYRLTH